MAEILLGTPQKSQLRGIIPPDKDGRNHGIALIDRLWIAPNERRTGLATNFLKEFEQAAVNAGATKIQTFLGVDQGEETEPAI